jgi:8-oxo-dGTP diphosphatase
MKSSKKITKQITVFCGVLIRNNQVLMVLRSEKECPKAHLKWEFPGGKVDFKETPEQALKREFFEESGITVKVKDILPFVQTSYWDYQWGSQQVLSFAYSCEFINQIVQINKDHHVEKIEWFDVNEVKNLKSLPGTDELMKVALANIRK